MILLSQVADRMDSMTDSGRDKVPNPKATTAVAAVTGSLFPGGSRTYGAATANLQEGTESLPHVRKSTGTYLSDKLRVANLEKGEDDVFVQPKIVCRPPRVPAGGSGTSSMASAGGGGDQWRSPSCLQYRQGIQIQNFGGWAVRKHCGAG